MNKTLRVVWLASILCGVACGQDRPLTVTLDIKGATLAETLRLLHEEVQVEFIVDPRVDQNTRITASVSDKPLDAALRLILGQGSHLAFELVEGVYLIKPAAAALVATVTAAPPPPVATPLPTPAPTLRPTRSVATPATPPGPGVTSPATSPGDKAVGSPMVEAKVVPKVIPLKYAYAPGIAVLLQNKTTKVRGQALLYSQIDPWAGALGGGSGLGGNQGGWGNNQGNWGNQNGWGSQGSNLGFGNQGGFGAITNQGNLTSFGTNRFTPIGTVNRVF